MCSDIYQKCIEELLKDRGYVLEKLLGKGATATVYLVRNQNDNRQYACKVSGSIKWIRPESELLAKLQHPIFPEWKEYWEQGEHGFLVMEYIPGKSLENSLKEKKNFTQEETIAIALELADGLNYLHERMQGTIYRDLKPENIMLQENGRPRLLDLGAAAIPNNWCAGTIAYASPEQKNILEHKAHPIHLFPSTDIYSLGKVMHYMLTGQDPLHQKEPNPVRKYNKKIRPSLSQTISQCLTPHPQQRIQDMHQLIKLLSIYHTQSPPQILYLEIKSFLKKYKRSKTVYTKNIWLSDHKT